MSWLIDLQKTNPQCAADYCLTGNQSAQALQNMVRALSLMPRLNTPDENLRLAAAKRLLRKG